MGVAFRRIAFTHLGCLLVLGTGVSAAALVTCAVTYAVRMFGVTAGYHRYFSHASFRTSRAFQLVLALLGAASGQRGPLWWASWHRRHHRDSDTDADVHSPQTRGFLWAHIGWLASDDYLETDRAQVPDLERFPELRWLDRHYKLVVFALIAALALLGAALARYLPHLGTSALQMVAWGFFVSTVLACHAVMGVNSVGHWAGTRAFDTGDASRNNWLLAAVTFGDGWHNNHHRYPGAARHGLTPGQLDLNWLVLRALAALGIVWELREPLPSGAPGCYPDQLHQP